MPIAQMVLHANARLSLDQAIAMEKPITILALGKVSHSPNASLITIVILHLKLLTHVP
jgi:hypothetical protein